MCFQGMQVMALFGKTNFLLTSKRRQFELWKCIYFRYSLHFVKLILKIIFLYAQSFFTFVYITSLAIVGERLASRVRQELFSSILRQDVAFFDTRKSGEIFSCLTNDVQDFKSSFKLCISQGLRSITQVSHKLSCIESF